MSTREKRLLEPHKIPKTLWLAGEDTLLLPESLRSVYAELLKERNLTHLAGERAKEGPVGGIGQEETDLHFAQAFSGSAARVLLAVLDPKNQVGDASDTFIRCTTGTSVCITDAPCGSGAAAAVFLCAIAELRAEGVVPREPLVVKLIGAELSPSARQYAREFMERISPFLSKQAIFLTWEFQSWDVTCELSTTDLVKRCVLASASSENKLLMIANFSGFLESNGKRKDADRQLQELFRYASTEKSFAIWMEPDMQKVTNSTGLFAWLSTKIVGRWKTFAKLLRGFSRPAGARDSDQTATCHAKFRHPLDAERVANVRLAVVAISLERGA
ncbi:hypothetical protein D3C71_877410 [compost metagenome]